MNPLIEAIIPHIQTILTQQRQKTNIKAIPTGHKLLSIRLIKNVRCQDKTYGPKGRPDTAMIIIGEIIIHNLDLDQNTCNFDLLSLNKLEWHDPQIIEKIEQCIKTIISLTPNNTWGYKKVKRHTKASDHLIIVQQCLSPDNEKIII